jgi:hypothetical protein
VGDGAFVQQGAEPAFVPLVDRHERLAEEQRCGDQQVAEEGPVGGGETEAEPDAPARVEKRSEEGTEQRAAERAPGEALRAGAEPRRKE